ncbi:endo-1,4-beta-xylanase [candidate division KSB1 bacterium]|nr:endo-1,4-beta-xylanase [candidate division KSB1 bacterium]
MNIRLQKFIATIVCLTALSVVCTKLGTPTLKKAYQKDFLMGVAVNPAIVSGRDSTAAEIVKTQFNSITSENVMKFGPIHPRPDEYNFKPADEFVEFGVKNGMFVIGHTLVWHSQTPRWVFQDEEGQPAGRDTLLTRMQDHIRTVVGRYKGRVRGWDVVNEAFADDGTLRNSPWYNGIGDDFIRKAFEYAHEADPDAELYYNDYNVWKPEKTAAVIQMVKDLRANGVRVDGVGEQAHWAFKYPTHEELEATLRAFREAGIRLLITEMDVSVLPNPWDYQGADIGTRFDQLPGTNPYTEGLPDSVQTKLAARYGELFSMFLDYSDIVDRVTLWGLDDGHSWLNHFPVRGRTNYPLLFDRKYQPKPAFDAVMEAAKAKQ